MTPGPTIKMAAGLSGLPDWTGAASHVSEQCAAALGSGGTDLVLVFMTAHHIQHAGELAWAIQKELGANCMIGVSAESVMGGRLEIERAPGVSVLAARLPGVKVVPFATESVLPYDDRSSEGLGKLGRGFGADESLKAAFVFADPFSVPAQGLVSAMSRARAHAKVGAIIGGMASGAEAANGNVLILNDAPYRAGLVGVSLLGSLRVDTVVSQGCRSIGAPMVVTGARKNVILTLGGKPAMHVMSELIESLPGADRELLQRGLFVGRVIDEYKDRFGRGDFLIREVKKVDTEVGAIIVDDVVRVGQTVQFHLRDAKTADEDLALLLDAQQLKDSPAGAVVITSKDRGRKFFQNANHDAAAIAKAFSMARSGEEASKGGVSIDPNTPTLPMAGFFAAGEIGPVGDQSFVHTHTACLGLFRAE